MSVKHTALHCPTCKTIRNHSTYIRQVAKNGYNAPAAPRVPSRPAWLKITYCLVCARTVHTPTAAPAA